MRVYNRSVGKVLTLTCRECGDAYRSPVTNHDSEEDLERGVVKGICTQCWREFIYALHGNGHLADGAPDDFDEDIP
jgi:hypothetical protein